jgi:hypothetical protein
LFSVFALVFTAVGFFVATSALVVAFLVVFGFAFVVGFLGTVDIASVVVGAVDASFVVGFTLAFVLGFFVLSCVDILLVGFLLITFFAVDAGVLISVVGGEDDATPVDGNVDSLLVVGSFSDAGLDGFVTFVALLVDGFCVEGALDELWVEGAPEEC